MPNLKHDPQNPADLLGRPLDVGDVVAWGTTYGRSPALTVAVIERIRFVDKPDSGYGRRQEVPRDKAKDYQLVLRPLRSTGSVSWMKPDGSSYYEYRDGPRRPGDGIVARTTVVRLVNNVVKLDGVDPNEVPLGEIV